MSSNFLSDTANSCFDYLSAMYGRAVMKCSMYIQLAHVSHVAESQPGHFVPSCIHALMLHIPELLV